MTVDRPRFAAYELLRNVGVEDSYANLILPKILKEEGLSGRDAAFVTELGYGTLRWCGLIDAVLESCLDRPMDRIDPRLIDVLRLGAYQILGMDVPPHAAVGETVELAREITGEGSAKLANAVLRKVARRDRDAWVAEVAPSMAKDPVGHLTIAMSHPAWIIRALAESLLASGIPKDQIWRQVRELLEADNEAARPTLVARPGRSTVDELLELDDVSPGQWSPYAATLQRGAPESISFIRDGRAGVQDEGSQLVAIAVASAPLEGADERWADLCAGPGGKAALLAGLALQRGAKLVAVERNPTRADLVRRTLKGASAYDVDVITGDATDLSVAPGPFDRVLVDVPCTGLGALRRRPESRWRRQPSDVGSLAPLQRAILSAAVDRTRVGGIIGYSTCSPHVAETDLVVTDIMRKRGDVEIVDAWATVPDVPRLEGTDETSTALRLWPHRHGTDGMYLALLRRTH